MVLNQFVPTLVCCFGLLLGVWKPLMMYNYLWLLETSLINSRIDKN